MKTNRPIRKGKIGPITYSVWANHGKHGTFYTVTFDRVYLHKDKQTGTEDLRYAQSFSLGDLILIQLAAGEAFQFIHHSKLLELTKQHPMRFVDHTKRPKRPP